MPAFKPEQPQPPESSERFYLEQAQQKLKELKEKAHNLIIGLKFLCSGKSKITQEQIPTLELSIQQIITDYEEFRRGIIFSTTTNPEFIKLEGDLQKQIKEFKTESAELLSQLKIRANRNSLTGKIKRIFK
jgi:archaellum component FlaC